MIAGLNPKIDNKLSLIIKFYNLTLFQRFFKSYLISTETFRLFYRYNGFDAMPMTFVVVLLF